jgi:hypothetical protein
VGITATLIIYAYYILTGYVNKMLMSPIVALTYNQVQLSATHRGQQAAIRMPAMQCICTGETERLDGDGAARD